MVGRSTHKSEDPDINKVTEHKYDAEASNVAQLLETNSKKAAEALRVDSKMPLHEFRQELSGIKQHYLSDKAKNPNLPDVQFIDSAKDGIKVSVKKDAKKEAETIFEQKPEELAKSSDKPIPKTGELLGLTPKQINEILELQNVVGSTTNLAKLP
jgi:hypothetical protein